MAAEYGLGETTGIDLPGEDTGQVDSAALRANQHKEDPTAFPYPSYYVGDNIETAFGQGETLVTPIQQAVAYATFANGGTRYQPQVAAAIVSPTGKLVKQIQPKVTGTVSLPPSTYQPMLEGFEGVVSDKSGTAYLPFQEDAHFPLSSYPIAGKTGTADVAAGKEPNAWFVGFGPTNHAGSEPEYVVAVVVDHGGYGAQAAAPAVAQHLQLPLRQPDPAGAAAHRRPISPQPPLRPRFRRPAHRGNHDDNEHHGEHVALGARRLLGRAQVRFSNMAITLSRSYPCRRANSTNSRTRRRTAPFSAVPVTVMPLPRPNSTRPSSRSMCMARNTVFLFTPRTAAMSLARGERSPGPASPSAMARRISAAT